MNECWMAANVAASKGNGKGGAEECGGGWPAAGPPTFCWNGMACGNWCGPNGGGGPFWGGGHWARKAAEKSGKGEEFLGILK